MTTDTPIYFDLLTPEIEAAMTREPWSYAAALKAADEAIAVRVMARPVPTKKTAATAKKAAKRAPRKAGS